MGLFGNPASDLDNLLDAMHCSSLDPINTILQGEHSANSSSLDNRMTQAARLVVELSSKGKRKTAIDMLSDWRLKDVPRLVMFRAQSGSSYQEARDEAVVEHARLSSTPDPNQEEKNANWRKIIDEIARRAGMDDSLAAPRDTPEP